MKRYTEEEFNNLPCNEFGIKECPAGDYSLISIFGEWCSFGEGCSFDEWCSFGKRCSFGERCSFDKGCSFGEGCSFGKWCSLGEGCSFGERCSLGKGCSFGEGCSLGKGCSFGEYLPSPIQLLQCNWGKVSDELTLELMRYDASNHPDPKKFDSWAKGGNCPYQKGFARCAYFEEKRELWKPGKTKSARELVIALLKEKHIIFKGEL